MRVYANQLPQHLQKGLLPFYLVCGEEPFQVTQCVAQIRTRAREMHFDEVIKLQLSPQFDWHELDGHYNSLSLFSSRTLIELDFNGHKPGKTGSAHLKQYSEQPNPDCIIVMHGIKASTENQRAAWFKALDAQGLFVPCYPLTGVHLKRWIDTQCQRLSLNVDDQAKQLLLDTTEGNLLACAQELEKLSLLYGRSAITARTLLGTILNQNKFDIFDLANAVLMGDSNKAVQVLARLQNDNLDATAIAWALNKEAQQLGQLQTLTHNGASFADTCKQLGIWKNQQAGYQRALGRLKVQHISHIIDLLAQFDALYKSGQLGSPYPFLAHISVSFCQHVAFEAPCFEP